MSLTHRFVAHAAATIASLALAHGAQAQEAPRFYVQAGSGAESAYASTLGITLPWRSWSWEVGGGVVRGQWDVSLSNWSSRPQGQARRNTLWIAAGPALRWRGAAGASPWFVELGTALAYANRHYRNDSDAFSTRYNFASHIGVGRNWGPHRQHELSLRVQHTSNAGIKDPNPGENFVLLRYAHAF